MISKELEAKIAEAETLDEVVKACAEEGVEVTKEMLEAELAKQETGELSEDALDDVSGGLVGMLALGAAAVVVSLWATKKPGHGGAKKPR